MFPVSLKLVYLMARTLRREEKRFMVNLFNAEFAGRNISLKANYMASQADGAILVTYGDTVVIVTVVSSKSKREGVDFLPLTVDYQEMTFAAGKIPGGFFKREGRPNEREILTSRIIDRSIRPRYSVMRTMLAMLAAFCSPRNIRHSVRRTDCRGTGRPGGWSVCL